MKESFSEPVSILKANCSDEVCRKLLLLWGENVIWVYGHIHYLTDAGDAACIFTEKRLC